MIVKFFSTLLKDWPGSCSCLGNTGWVLVCLRRRAAPCSTDPRSPGSTPPWPDTLWYWWLPPPHTVLRMRERREISDSETETCGWGMFLGWLGWGGTRTAARTCLHDNTRSSPAESARSWVTPGSSSPRLWLMTLTWLNCSAWSSLYLIQHYDYNSWSPPVSEIWSVAPSASSCTPWSPSPASASVSPPPCWGCCYLHWLVFCRLPCVLVPWLMLLVWRLGHNWSAEIWSAQLLCSDSLSSADSLVTLSWLMMLLIEFSESIAVCTHESSLTATLGIHENIMNITLNESSELQWMIPISDFEDTRTSLIETLVWEDPVYDFLKYSLWCFLWSSVICKSLDISLQRTKSASKHHWHYRKIIYAQASKGDSKLKTDFFQWLLRSKNISEKN